MLHLVIVFEMHCFMLFRKYIHNVYKKWKCSEMQLHSITKSFYYVKYGLTIITWKVSRIFSVMKIKTLVFPEKLYFKNSLFDILIQVLSWRQQKHQCLCFHYWDYLTNFWQNIWQSIFDNIERLYLCLLKYVSAQNPPCM